MGLTNESGSLANLTRHITPQPSHVQQTARPPNPSHPRLELLRIRRRRDFLGPAGSFNGRRVPDRRWRERRPLLVECFTELGHHFSTTHRQSRSARAIRG